MLSGKQFQRYSRQLMLEDVGESGQEKLSQASILIVGLGGLGSPAAMYLAAAGVGRLLLADPDRLDLTNLQRQVLYQTADIGGGKAALAATALAALNPEIRLEAIDSAMDRETLDQHLPGVDLVLDCTDNGQSRQDINRACFAHRLPLLSAAALGWEGQLAGFDFRAGAGPCYSCLIAEGSPEPVASCATTGVIGPVLGIMGSMQAVEAVRLLVSGSCSVFGQLRRYDGKRGSWFRVGLVRQPSCPVCGNPRVET